MKRQFLSYFVALPALMLALSAQAHSPEEHINKGQAPNCAAMKDMDHSKIDMNDPVMQAMMQKCMPQDEAASEDGHSSHDMEADAYKPAEYQH